LAKEMPRVRYRSIQRVVLAVVLCSLAGYLGCAAPKPCIVSPVDIEEIRSDIRDLDATLAQDKEVLSKLQADVVAVRAQVEERKAQLPVLQAEFERLKKASGVTEKPEPQTTSADSTAGS
jgi:septal ring factor EnvC (AmiA/AmiB activator)